MHPLGPTWSYVNVNTILRSSKRAGQAVHLTDATNWELHGETWRHQVREIYICFQVKRIVSCPKKVAKCI